jgi:hypothetical protein
MLTYSTVIPTKDRSQKAHVTVEGMLRQTRPPERIVVVDASEQPLAFSPTLLEDLEAAGIELVLAHAEPSTAAQRNLGVELVETPTVLFLDDDVSLEATYAEVLLCRWEAAGLEAFGGVVGSPEFVPSQSTLARLLRRVFMLHYQNPKAKATAFRRSRKLRFVPRPAREVTIPAVGAGGPFFRTDLVRKYRFEERFTGYALGEDLDMSCRLSAEAPILQSPAVRFLHEWHPDQRESELRWYHRGRRETYFRLRHLDRSPLSLAAFALSLVAETVAAGLDSLRQRDTRHVRGFVRGLRETLGEARESR